MGVSNGRNKHRAAMNLFDEIDSTQSLAGWCSPLKAATLASLVIALRPKISVELGVFSGRSFLPIALAHKYIGSGVAIGIDPWTNDAAIEGYEAENKSWWASLNLEKIKQDFLKQITISGVQDFVSIHEIKSDNFIPPEGIGLCHIDGQHTSQSLKDAKRMAQKMIVGGVIVLDDLHWENDGALCVSWARIWLMENGFKELYTVFNKPDGADDWGVFVRIF